MLIESTEEFLVSTGIAIQRGPNELAESDFERLPLATQTKLRILQEHGVLRLWPSNRQNAAPRPESEEAGSARAL